MTNEFDRRSVLRLGGLTVAAGAVLAACGAGENGGTNGVGAEGIPQIGTAPPLAKAGSKDITDARLLRTATSMHYNGIDAITRALAVSGLDPKVADLAKKYQGLLKEQADALAKATTDIGGTAFEEKNPAINANIVDKAFGDGTTAGLIGLGPSPADDTARFLQAFATLAAETHQSFVPLLSQPALRSAAMQIGAAHHRVSAALARAISPANIVNLDGLAIETAVTEAPATTVAGAADTGPAPIPVYQIPGTFGPLGAVSIVLGKPGVDDETKRTQLNIETPSLNSLIADPT